MEPEIVKGSSLVWSSREWQNPGGLAHGGCVCPCVRMSWLSRLLDNNCDVLASVRSLEMYIINESSEKLGYKIPNRHRNRSLVDPSMTLPYLPASQCCSQLLRFIVKIVVIFPSASFKQAQSHLQGDLNS